MTFVFGIYLSLRATAAREPVKGGVRRTEPCFGECNWTIDSHSASGIVRISGPDSAVSDISPSAGWSIIDCDRHAADQDIRLVCQDPSRGCAHVYLNGAQDTLVRLPENCGSMPFAVVAREWWTHSNQSIPQQLELARRDNASLAEVKGMSLTTKFGSIGTARHGVVNVFLVGSSIPGVADDFLVVPGVGNESDSLQRLVDGSLRELAQAHAGLSVGNFNTTKTGAFPLNFDKKVSLYQKNMTCPQQGKRPAFLGQLLVGVEPSVNGSISYGVSAAGSIIPPQLNEFGFYVGLDATLSGALNVGASLTGSLSSGPIPLLSVGLPELSYPGILSIGPTFSINALATASIDTYLNVSAGLAYDVRGMQVSFTSSSRSQTGNVTVGKTGEVQLSASPSVTAHGQLAAHLIPSIAFGVSAFDGKAQTTVRLDFDAETSLDLSLAGFLEAPRPDQCHKRIRLAFDGCADVSSGFSVNAGADADFFDIFKKGASVSLFEKDFDLYKRCFGKKAAALDRTRRYGRRSTCPTSLVARSGNISCPASYLRSPRSIT
ncbi:hypothetical protein C8Q73DRAFT_645192 [Cubamyces lactineus]|nr:hypothetical protein C8Q73DRAFT_645192 [Cubamyces lactineus]